MKRAAVIIGVDQYPHLPPLAAAVAGAREVSDWAASMNFEVHTIDDETEPVTVARIKAVVTGLVQRSGEDALDQLLIYFAGHGVNKGFAEYWLLSSAPDDPNEAVNVNGSIDIARYTSGIHHIVIISDACRTAAGMIHLQNVGGSFIFPNPNREAEPSVIDRFYAARPGHPALEIRAASHAEFRALYTDCVLQALSGREASARERLTDPRGDKEIVTPRGLKAYLATALPERISSLRLKRTLDPDALVESVYPAYLSVFDSEPSPAGATTERNLPLRDEEETFLAGLLRDSFDPGRSFEPATASSISVEMQRLMAAVRTVEHPTSPGIAVLVSGSDRLASARCSTARCELMPSTTASPAFVTITSKDPSTRHASHDVLLTLASRRTALLPAFPGFMATVVINGDELVDVAYEPLRTHAEGGTSMMTIRLRRLRAAIAAAARQARFRMTPELAKRFESRVRELKGFDPTLDLYLAYAFSEAGVTTSIESFAENMRRILGTVLYDVAMLARRPAPGAAETLRGVAGACPLLTQGWTMLDVKGIALSDGLRSARQYLLPSLWTFFAAPAEEILTREIENEER